MHINAKVTSINDKGYGYHKTAVELVNQLYVVHITPHHRKQVCWLEELEVCEASANPCSYDQFYYELLVWQMPGLLDLFLFPVYNTIKMVLLCQYQLFDAILRVHLGFKASRGIIQEYTSYVTI